MKKIYIVVLHFGKVEITRSCVESLKKNEYYPYKLIIVNNTHKSLADKDFNAACLVINNNENKGFAGGVNAGIKAAIAKNADAVFLLNNDTKIKKPFLKSLVNLLFLKKEIGIVGPAIEFKKHNKKLFDIGGYVTWFGKTFHNEVTTVKNIQPHEITYMTGAAMLIKKEVFQKTGLFDNAYFLYYEDIDFCIRTKRKGFTIFTDPKVSISHSLSKTVGKLSPLAIYHQTKSALIFGKKYYNWPITRVINRNFIFFQTINFLRINPKGGLKGLQAIGEYLLQQKWFRSISFFLLLGILSLLSFWRGLSFSFWMDDTHLIWASLYNFAATKPYFNHPGLPLEFLLLSRIFGVHQIVWQIFGIFLRAAVAYVSGLFILEFTGSKKAGALSSIFLAVSYLGLETINSPVTNIAALATIPLLIFLLFLIKGIKKSVMYLWVSFFFFIISFIFDPARIVPIFLCIPIFLTLVGKGKNNKALYKLLKRFIFLGIIIFPIFIVWFSLFERQSQIVAVLHALSQKQFGILAKLNRVGNLFATIGNIFFGLLYSISQTAQNIAVYSKLFNYIGIGLFFIGIFSSVVFSIKKNKVFGYITFFLLWIFAMYFPNWLSEPRAPMAGPHRYVFLSGVGFAFLLAYLLSLIKTKWIMIGLSMLIIGLNIYKANTILSWQRSYRDRVLVNGVWNTIISKIPQNQTNNIFVFTGQEPYLSHVLNYSNLMPIFLARNIHNDPSLYPVQTTDQQKILQMICTATVFTYNDKVYTRKPIPLSHVFAWNIQSRGKLIDNTEEERISLQKIYKNYCQKGSL